ncbi:AGE family epimerase/isomerase [Halomarina halobia]|uniref:AGE family epimerase/isomerase n=1 Tax=Halomarina halobia TaxID=3033386 RepID=A0ABD6AE66_9EURY|nr:AGE family epimerase/isomerase [Halomarina sp. PSR21]
MDDWGTADGLFRDERWVRQHLTNLLSFYHPTCIDTTHGGYVAQLGDRDGTIYDGRTKHLVATCRFVFNYSVGHLLDGPTWCAASAEHGLRYLLSAHRRDDGGYAWVMDGRRVADGTRSTYGHAFVLLALATAAKAGVPPARDHLDETYALIDERFWEPDPGLCLSDLDSRWRPVSTYRGQNANMHMCEAHLAAYEATGDERYLERASRIAENIARTLADEGDGLVWEHYTEDWEIDPAYNRDRPDHLFRPWGYQPGHLLEWSKLLLSLARHRSEAWLLARAVRFFDAAVEHGWDDGRGGFVYNFDRDGAPIVADRYYWPLAEGIGAATLLAEATGDARYREWYDRIWTYAWDHVVNRRHGNWYFKLTPENEVHEGIDATPEVKVGYHQINACYEVLRTTGGARAPR